MTITRARTRLAPERRRTQLLDVAAGIVQRERRTGALTMDRLAEEAAVSAGLVYLYFPKREALLLALMDRELERYDAAMRRVEHADAYEERVRLATAAYFDHVQRHGQVLDILFGHASSEPAVERARRRRREKRIDYWVEQAEAEFGIPRRRGRVVARMLQAAGERAAEDLLAGRVSRREAEHLHCTLVLASVSALAAEVQPT